MIHEWNKKVKAFRIVLDFCEFLLMGKLIRTPMHWEDSSHGYRDHPWQGYLITVAIRALQKSAMHLSMWKSLTWLWKMDVQSAASMATFLARPHPISQAIPWLEPKCSVSTQLSHSCTSYLPLPWLMHRPHMEIRLLASWWLPPRYTSPHAGRVGASPPVPTAPNSLWSTDSLIRSLKYFPLSCLFQEHWDHAF